MSQVPAPVPSSAGYSDTDGLHTHPVPPLVRWALVAFSIAVTLLLVLGVTVYLAGQRRDASQVERVRAQLIAELDRRSAARDRREQETREQTNMLVCRVLAADLNSTETVQQLAAQLRCPR